MSRRRDVATIDAAGADVPLLVQLLKLAALISRPMQQDVALANGISVNELKVLMCLSGEGAIAGRDIAFIMSMHPMNVSRALAALEALGWVEKAAASGNRRRRPVQLSAVGWKAYGGMLGDIRAVAQRLFARLGKSERLALARAFEGVIEEVEGWEGAAAATDEARAGKTALTIRRKGDK